MSMINSYPSRYQIRLSYLILFLIGCSLLSAVIKDGANNNFLVKSVIIIHQGRSPSFSNRTGSIKLETTVARLPERINPRRSLAHLPSSDSFDVLPFHRHRDHRHRGLGNLKTDFLLLRNGGRRREHLTLSPKEISQRMKEAPERIQQQIINEMKGYNFSELEDPNFPNKTVQLDDLVMEKGGEPIRSLVFASWRTGSTFTAAILDSHPAMFYEYEPFLHFKLHRARDGPLADEAIQAINGILTCNYTAIPRYREFLQPMRSRSEFARQLSSTYHGWPRGSDDPNFRSKLCRMFPFQALKTVRLRLRLGRTLLEDKRFQNHLKIVLLIRDPRAVMNSRLHGNWCVSLSSPDCSSVDRLCEDMEDDYEEAKMLREMYPDRFMAIRYEEIVQHPIKATQKIFKFFRLQFLPQTLEFLGKTTKKKFIKDRPYKFAGVNLVRDSKTMVSHWMRDLGRRDGALPVMKVQRSCEKAMKMWGYAPLVNLSQLSSGTFTAVLNPPWPEMIVQEANETNYKS